MRRVDSEVVLWAVSTADSWVDQRADRKDVPKADLKDKQSVVSWDVPKAVSTAALTAVPMAGKKVAQTAVPMADSKAVVRVGYSVGLMDNPLVALMAVLTAGLMAERWAVWKADLTVVLLVVITAVSRADWWAVQKVEWWEHLVADGKAARKARLKADDWAGN